MGYLLFFTVFAVFAAFSAVEGRPEKRETFHGEKVISAVPKDDKQLLVLQVNWELIKQGRELGSFLYYWPAFGLGQLFFVLFRFLVGNAIHPLAMLRKPSNSSRLWCFLGISFITTTNHSSNYYKLQPFQSPSFLLDRFLTQPGGVQGIIF